MSGKRPAFSIPPPLQTLARPPPEGSEASPGWDWTAKLRTSDTLRGEQGCWVRAEDYEGEAACEDWACAREEEAESRPDVSLPTSEGLMWTLKPP